MSEGYGRGTSGNPGIGPLGIGSTQQRHAVADAWWRPNVVKAPAMCTSVVVLDWAWGQPLAFSLKDANLCPKCLAAIGVRR